MAAISDRPRVESRMYENRHAPVPIRDSRCGLGFEANRISNPFFGGRLSASPNCPHGAVFWFELQTSRESSS